ncbi:2257_t:CDS:1, partial [Acaulospora morrowiae]
PVKDSPCEYVKIYRQCWRDDPIKRPDIHEVLNILLNIEIPDNLSNAINISNGIGIVSTRPIKTRGNSDDKILKEGSDDKILSSSPTESASSDGTLCSITEVDQLPTNNDKKLSTELGKKKPQVNLGGKRLSTDVGGCRRLGCRGLSVEVGSKRLSANLGSKKSPTDVASRNSSIDVGRKLSTETGKMKSPTKETVRKKSSLDVSEKKPSNSDVGNKTSTERPKPARRVTSINTELSQSIRKTENRRSSFNGVSGNTTPTTPTNPNSIANKKIIDNTDAAFFEDLLKFFISILEISGDFPAMISSIKEYLHNKSREHKSTFKALIKHKDNPAFGSIIGFFYENSIGTVQDKQAAFTSYKKSADSGDAIGQYFLGRCYYWGHGIKTDRKKAFELLQKSSENGNSRGQWMLGFCYERGYGTTKDLKKAFEQFLHSAEAGNVTSQMELGRCYEEGIGVDKNLGKAIECYQHAFARGHVLASKKIEALKKAQRRN